MANADVSPEDREAIRDTLASYVWAMDTGDIDGVVATFTAAGAVKDRTGVRWDAPNGPRRFATHFLGDPARKPRQHWVQNIAFEAAADGAVRLTSYWMTVAWAPGELAAPQMLGRYSDTFVKEDGRWLMREKLIDPWEGK